VTQPADLVDVNPLVSRDAEVLKRSVVDVAQTAHDQLGHAKDLARPTQACVQVHPTTSM